MGGDRRIKIYTSCPSATPTTGSQYPPSQHMVSSDLHARDGIPSGKRNEQDWSSLINYFYGTKSRLLLSINTLIDTWPS